MKYYKYKLKRIQISEALFHGTKINPLVYRYIQEFDPVLARHFPLDHVIPEQPPSEQPGR